MGKLMVNIIPSVIFQNSTIIDIISRVPTTYIIYADVVDYVTYVDTHAWYIQRADVVELVDTHALGACAARREGSSPFIRTIEIHKKTTP